MALNLERQVLLVSSSASVLTYVGEALLSFLYPLSWSHVYIPLLPQIATTILSAPVPYFCGVLRSVLPSALMDMSQEAIIVDIDYNTLTIGPATPESPPFPHTRKNKLYDTLSEVVNELQLDRSECKYVFCVASGDRDPKLYNPALTRLRRNCFVASASPKLPRSHPYG